jgi:putative spermidine/putrescine transport system ATP-binding protein
MSEAILSLRGLTVAYGGKPAVHALDLDVQRGEVLSLLGPSGCGKTTTMRAIAGLLQPASGQIHLAGKDVTDVPANKRGVGLVFQSYALFPHLPASENIAFGLRLQKRPHSEITERVNTLLQAVGLSAFSSRLPAELSGGQQQRVALARALVMKPDLLLLDEPLSNLDARLRLEMRGELARLQKQLGTTMVYVTHDQTEALALSTRIAVMREGRIEQMGTPEEIWTQPRTAFVARFMGFETILGEQSDGRLTVVPQAALVLHQPQHAAQALLAWRPDMVVVGTGPYRARVVAASYQGRATEALLDTEFGPVKTEIPVHRARLVVGETVAFDLPLSSAVKIPAFAP